MSDLGFIQSSPKKEYTGIKTLRKLTIKQLRSAVQEDNSTISYVDNAELSSLQLMGWVISSKLTATGKTFVLEDGTGHIDCMIWPNKIYEEKMCDLVEESVLCCVIGSLKLYSGRQNINVSSRYIVEDYNELTYHFTSCLREFLFYTKKESGKREMSKLEKDIIACLKNNQGEDGLVKGMIFKCLENFYTEKAIEEGLRELVDNSYVVLYDNGVYKST